MGIHRFSVFLWHKWVIILTIIISSACNLSSNDNHPPFSTVDPNATKETRALYANLLKYQDGSIMFGHQDALAYGIGWWAEDFRSDVHDVSGKMPAVFGWDAGKIGSERNIDSVSFQKMSTWIIKAFEKGGINTLSWHMDNPVTGGDSWDKTPAVHTIIPGGENHDFYKSRLDDLADFIGSLKTSDGIPVPLVFRPFHELNHNWFWWGRNHCAAEDFIAMFRFTVEYLRDEKNLHNILYSYSPDRFTKEEDYLERFPGEDYVDILGYDDYRSLFLAETVPNAIQSLRIVAKLAERMNKPFAFTETGFETIPEPVWWTKHLLDPIRDDSLARRASWVLVWRNNDKTHHYAPYPGHPSAENFRDFEKDSFTWFLEDIPDMYNSK